MKFKITGTVDLKLREQAIKDYIEFEKQIKYKQDFEFNFLPKSDGIRYIYNKVCDVDFKSLCLTVRKTRKYIKIADAEIFDKEGNHVGYIDKLK